jgi:hypothetical protein
MAAQIYEWPADNPIAERVYAYGSVVTVLQAATAARLEIRVGSAADWVPCTRGTRLALDVPFDVVSLRTSLGVADTIVQVAIGDKGDEIDIPTVGEVGYEATQGPAGLDPWSVILAGAAEAKQGAAGEEAWRVTDASSVALARGAFQDGAAHGEELTAAAPGSIDSNVAGTLGRNARYGHVQAHPDNAGLASVAISHDGDSFVPLAYLLAGASFDLSGLDVAVVRVTFDTADDSVIVGGW